MKATFKYYLEIQTMAMKGQVWFSNTSAVIYKFLNSKGILAVVDKL